METSKSYASSRRRSGQDPEPKDRLHIKGKGLEDQSTEIRNQEQNKEQKKVYSALSTEGLSAGQITEQGKKGSLFRTEY